MKLIKLGAASLNQTPLDWDGNYKNIIQAIDAAAKENVNILCLPELCITGYGCEDAFFMPSTAEKSIDVLKIITEHIKYICKKHTISVSIGFPYTLDGFLYNCVMIYGNVHSGCIIPKKNLCSDGVHYESRWFKPWQGKSVTVHIPNIGKFMFGNVMSYFQGTDLKIGVEICEDAWAVERPGSLLAKHGVDIILNPSASHFSFGKNKIRERFVEEGSRAFKCAYIYSNLVGNESGRVIFDGDTYIASEGKIISRGERFSYNNYTLTTAVIDVDKNRVQKIQNTSNIPIHDYDNNKNLSKFVGFSHKESNIDLENNFKPIRGYGPALDLNNDFDSFTAAVSLGLWDYMRKSYSKGFVLSLSGGADSSACACLVRSMIINAVNALGRESFIEKLKEIGIDASELDKNIEVFIKQVSNKLLTCVYQGTENSSDETEKSAFLLSSEIGARFHTISVQKVLEEYISLSEKMIGRKLSWEEDDITLQNIQARARAPSVWMMANIAGALLLSTSNRSEAAVGYATMDGDTCGGLSPIAGVSKIFLLKWLVDYEKSWGIHGFHGLDLVNKLTPTAELRPQDNKQTDEDDLMPYDILNKIEYMAVKYKMSPEEIVSADKDKISPDHVIKFFKMFTKNQWKRERYAPSFHLDDESLDPKTFHRFPILNSGFKQEIDEILSSTMKEALE